MLLQISKPSPSQSFVREPHPCSATFLYVTPAPCHNPKSKHKAKPTLPKVLLIWISSRQGRVRLMKFILLVAIFGRGTVRGGSVDLDGKVGFRRLEDSIPYLIYLIYSYWH